MRVLERVRPRLKDPAVWVLAGLFVSVVVGCTWGLPGTDSWCADSISPRSCGLGAIAETYLPGHYHAYPPLHMAILTVMSLPWMALAAARVGTSVEALGAELLKPLYMTGIEAGARLVALAMALAIVWTTIRLWSRIAGRRVGIGAGLVTATNTIFVYYAHTGNLEVPYLFWVTWAVLELDRVACGEPREGRVLLLAVLAALTKQTAVAALLLPLPLYLLVVPWRERRASPLRRGVWRGAVVGVVAYALISGAIVNPTGFRRHLAFTFGPGSQTWARYPRGLGGTLFFARAVVEEIPHFTSWPIALAAVVGIVLALGWGGGERGERGEERGGERLARLRLLLPLAAGVSQGLFLHLLGRRTEERFLLPVMLWLLPYAALAFDRAWGWTRERRVMKVALGVLAALALALAVRGVASIDATLLFDPRYAAERFLAALPGGSHVELVGGPMFLPHVPPNLVAIRPGVEPLGERQAVPGIQDIVDPAMDPRPRAPTAIVVADGATPDVILTMNRPFGLMQYRDPISLAFFRGLVDGTLGYSLAYRAACALPWPLECRAIHSSTAGEVWIYEPTSRR
jgi:hypothetical protein